MSSKFRHSASCDVKNATTSSRTNENRRHSIEMTSAGFSPYEMPLSSKPDIGLDDYSLPSINTVTTTLEYGDGDISSLGRNRAISGLGRTSGASASQTDAAKNPNGRMTHGFFFGAVSTELLNKQVDGGSEKENNKYDNNNDNDDDSQFIDDDNDDLFDDEDMRGIYARSDLERWVRASQNSFKPSPELGKREVLSKRIKDVGFIGQNIGIGHLTGVWKEDTMLIPKAVILKTTSFYISEDSPLQQDLCWERPENASTFTTLAYNVDVMLPDQEQWCPLTTVRHTVFRIYHTDHTLLVGKRRLGRQNHDLILRLRVGCQGEMSYATGAKHWTVGPWSQEVELVFLGYGTKPQPVILEQTAL